MSLQGIIDARLPGLARVADGATFLADLTKVMEASGHRTQSFASMRIIRIRYRPGERAILNVEFTSSHRSELNVPASIWLHGGTKAAKRAAHQNSSQTVYEPQSGALVFFFPADPQVAELGIFHANPSAYARSLWSEDVASVNMPEVVRFRPGLGATFRWSCAGREPIYVKIQKGLNVEQVADTLPKLQCAAMAKSFAVPQLAGLDSSINAYAMRAVAGGTFDDILAVGTSDSVEHHTRQLLAALKEFAACGVSPSSLLDHRRLVERALTSAKIVCRLAPQLGSVAARAAEIIAQTPVSLHAFPAHGDMKLEHIHFLDHRVYLLDLDSFTLADPLYDLAMLDIRVSLHAVMTDRKARHALGVRRMIIKAAAAAGGRDWHSRFMWLRTCCALELAKHHCENPRVNSQQLALAALSFCHGVSQTFHHQKTSILEASSCA